VHFANFTTAGATRVRLASGCSGTSGSNRIPAQKASSVGSNPLRRTLHALDTCGTHVSGVIKERRNECHSPANQLPTTHSSRVVRSVKSTGRLGDAVAPHRHSHLNTAANCAPPCMSLCPPSQYWKHQCQRIGGPLLGLFCGSGGD